MKRKFVGHRPRAEQTEQLHFFEAGGEAPFVRLPKGAAVVWSQVVPFVIEASGGLFRAGESLSTCGRGTFRIIPVGACTVRVEYECPLFLLNYAKLAETLANRYEVEVWLRPQWRADLWPFLFRHYVRTGEWPTHSKEYAKFFRHILLKSDIAEITKSERATRVERARRRFAATALARLGRNRSARMLAVENTVKIVRRIIGAECYPQMLAEMDMFRSIGWRRSIMPLAGEYFEDELRFKVPFEIAPARRVVVSGRCNIEFMWEYGEWFGPPRLCSSAELVPTGPLVLSHQVIVSAPRAHIPLDAGAKRAYGVRFNAPLICKGEDVRMWIRDSDRSLAGQARRRLRGFTLRRPVLSAPDTTNLHIKVAATEA